MKIMAQVEFLHSWVPECGIFVFNLTPFASNLNFSYFYLHGSGSVNEIRIQIHKVVEYGSTLDPDPQHWC